jgi:hypothetical protein
VRNANIHYSHMTTEHFAMTAGKQEPRKAGFGLTGINVTEAAERRKIVASGVSHWDGPFTIKQPRRGGRYLPPYALVAFPCRPSGAARSARPHQWLTPLATVCRCSAAHIRISGTLAQKHVLKNIVTHTPLDSYRETSATARLHTLAPERKKNGHENRARCLARKSGRRSGAVRI